MPGRCKKLKKLAFKPFIKVPQNVTYRQNIHIAKIASLKKNMQKVVELSRIRGRN